MLTCFNEEKTHTVIIEITSGRNTDFGKVKNALSGYMNIKKESRLTESIAANVPSGMIGQFSNISQWLRCETKYNQETILSICSRIGKKYLTSIYVYKWDNRYLEDREGTIRLDLGDPI